MKASLPIAVFFLGAATTAALAADTPGTSKVALPFTEDDYPGAMKQARAKKVPVFVEAWAPW